MGWSVNKESRMIYKIHLQRKSHIRHVGRKIPNDFNNDLANVEHAFIKMAHQNNIPFL